MTHIEAALAKVRALREAERKMTPGPWADETTNYQPPGYPRALIRFGDGFKFNEVIAPNVLANDSAGIAALRNAAPPLLDLLGALLEEFLHGGAAGYNARYVRTQAALAAFVEAEDGK